MLVAKVLLSVLDVELPLALVLLQLVNEAELEDMGVDDEYVELAVVEGVLL